MKDKKFTSPEEEKTYYRQIMKNSKEASEEESKKIITGIRRGIQKKRMTSIRLDESLLTDLKKLAMESGIPYQTYMRMVLTKHVSEIKKHEKAS